MRSVPARRQTSHSSPRFFHPRKPGRARSRIGPGSVSPPPIPAQSEARKCWLRRHCDKATGQSSGGEYFPRFALIRQLGCVKNDESRMTKLECETDIADQRWCCVLFWVAHAARVLAIADFP